MKKLILILCVLLTLSFSYLQSQVKYSDNANYRIGYWNIAFSLGPMFNVSDQLEPNYRYYPGYAAGFELFYTLKDKVSSIVFGFNFSKARSHDYENSFYIQSGYTEKKELTFGPRFYIWKGFFAEAALGTFLTAYNFKVDLDKFNSGLGNFKIAYAGFGGALGVGKTFSLSYDTDLMIRAKLSVSIPGRKTIQTTSLNAGVIFNNKGKDTKNNSSPAVQSLWSFSATGGITSPEFLNTRNYNIAPNLGLEMALRRSPNTEIIFDMNYNTVNEKNTSLFDKNIFNLTFGPRFFLGEGKYQPFAEVSAGIYYYSYAPDVLFMGGNFGAGAVME